MRLFGRQLTVIRDARNRTSNDVLSLHAPLRGNLLDERDFVRGRKLLKLLTLLLQLLAFPL